MPQLSFKEIDRYIWEIPTEYDRTMKVPTRIYATKDQLNKMQQDRTIHQGINVSTLPGIYKFSIILPDGHQGYGFPIGGVAAFDADEGIISPGGIGYDINCGVRVMYTNLDVDDVLPRLRALADALFRNVPAGLGSRRRDFSVSMRELDEVSRGGAQYIIEKFGLGWDDDPLHIEEEGRIEGADPDKVGMNAKRRGLNQLGTLGSGNHFLEIQKVDKIFDPDIARVLGITHEGQVTVMVHTGSRGFGHQICSDYLKVMDRLVHRMGIRLRDRELVYAPIKSREADDYLKAFKCAVNYAFANRQAISHWVREAFAEVYKTDPDKLGLKIIYDVAHNIAKLEEHDVDGRRVRVYVHRKGATRSLPPGHPLTPRDYKDVGQPVLIPGSMGTASYILIGVPKSLDRSFGSAPHGSGRLMSRHAAKRAFRAERIVQELGSRGIIIRAESKATIVEESDQAYKSVDDVALVAEVTGLAKRVARMVPLAVVKG
jgi:tRNA-splicing ligase RtcB